MDDEKVQRGPCVKFSCTCEHKVCWLQPDGNWPAPDWFRPDPVDAREIGSS
ncbi:hypothetical protein HispidOSU_009141 [Sigmodon hispidus]